MRNILETVFVLMAASVAFGALAMLLLFGGAR